MITLGKKGDLPAYRRANAFILKPTLVPKVFGALAQRYADRPGGYTRIHKFGNRPGDNAPHAILEFVDNPRDLRFEMTARSVGWEMLGRKVGDVGAEELINSGVRDIHGIVEKEKNLGHEDRGGILRPRTRSNLQKVLRYRKDDATQELRQKINDHIVRSENSATTLLIYAHYSERKRYWPNQSL
jgi:large subunit ribosomal protein L17